MRYPASLQHRSDPAQKLAGQSRSARCPWERGLTFFVIMKLDLHHGQNRVPADIAAQSSSPDQEGASEREPQSDVLFLYHCDAALALVSLCLERYREKQRSLKRPNVGKSPSPGQRVPVPLPSTFVTPPRTSPEGTASCNTWHCGTPYIASPWVSAHRTRMAILLCGRIPSGLEHTLIRSSPL